MMRKHGCKQRYLTDNGYTFSYAERGRFNCDKPTMLFLHGFSAGKDMFWPFMPVSFFCLRKFVHLNVIYNLYVNIFFLERVGIC